MPKFTIRKRQGFWVVRHESYVSMLFANWTSAMNYVARLIRYA